MCLGPCIHLPQQDVFLCGDCERSVVCVRRRRHPIKWTTATRANWQIVRAECGQFGVEQQRQQEEEREGVHIRHDKGPAARRGFELITRRQNMNRT